MQPVEQHVSVQRVVRRIVAGAILEKQMAVQAEPRGGGRGLAGMVGLNRALGDDGIAAFAQRIADQEFQFAGFVSAAGKPGAIIRFIQRRGPPRCFDNRSIGSSGVGR